MVLVSSFERSAKDRSTVHRPTRCLYAIIVGDAGKRLLQLDTLGPEDRQFAEKVSQSIQFDRQGAERLLELIRETFPDLA